MSQSALLSRCCALLVVSGWLLASGVVSVAEEKPSDQQAQKRKAELKQNKEKVSPDEKVALSCAAVSSSEATIQKALCAPTVIEFLETPLAAVVDYLKDYHHVEIQIDKRAFDEMGAGTDTPVSLNLRGITLRSALDLMLDVHKLDWVIDHEVLLITTKDAADAMRVTQIYNLAPLIGDDSAEELAEVIRQTILSVDQQDENADISIVPFRHVLIVRHNPRGQRQVAQFLEQLHAALEHK